MFAASEVRAAGWGGLETVSTITGIARSTIGRGLKDLEEPALPPADVSAELYKNNAIGKRNDLIKLIARCKAAGVQSNLNPADVGALELEQLDQQIARLGQALLTQGAAK